MIFSTQQAEVASHVRLGTSDTNLATLIKRWLNQAGKEIWARADWNFSLDRQVVQTVADKTDGTVSVSSGGQTVTGSSTAFTSLDVGKFIQFESTHDWYKITAVASTTSLTIESPYTDTSALSAGDYTIRKFFYSMGSTCEKILTARQSISPSFLHVCHFREMDIFRPDPTTTGSPIVMAVFGLDSSNNIQFTPWPWPDAVENLEIRFKKNYVDLSADSDVSLIPEKWHATVMIDGAISRAYRYAAADEAGFKRAALARQQFEQGMDRMLAEQDVDVSYHPVLETRDMLNDTIGPRLPFKFGL